jgi:tetratricopeptide (TPR) repeat protein
MAHQRKILWAAFLWFIVCLATPAGAVTPYDDVMVQQAVENLKQENYDEAIALLNEAWQKGARTPEKAFLLAQAHRQLLEYPKARTYLEDALRLKPDFPAAQLLMADTLMALEKPKEALPILKELEAKGHEPAQVAFLMGLANMKEGKPKEALECFRKAEQDPRVAQEAKYQACLALVAQNQLREARKNLEETISINAESQTADFAKRYMVVIDNRLEELRPYHASVSFGFDYDSNVTLQAGGTGAPAQPTGQGDIVYTQAAMLDYTLFTGQPFTIMAQYGYYQNFHRRIPTYDMLSHTLNVVPAYNFTNARIYVPFSYNYVDVQSDKYYTGYLVTPALLYLFTENWGIEVAGRFNRKYYWWPIYYPQDNRDSKNFGGGVGLYYFFKKQKGFVVLRPSFEYDDTTGTNWNCATYRLLFSVLYPVTDKFKINAFIDMYLQPYDHTYFSGQTLDNIPGNPLLPQPKRYDKMFIGGLQLTYELYKGLEFNIHYFYSRDDSNILLYDYHRHIVGCQIGYRY